MRLYHVITTYHLLSAMTMQSASEEEGILLIPVWIKLKYPSYQSLDKIFHSIFVYDASYRYKHTKEDTAQYFRKLLPPLDGFSDIFVWGAQYSFGVFLAEYNFSFIFCEEATGMHSRLEIVQHIDAVDPKLKDLYPYVCELGLYTGECRSAKKILCNFSAQLDGHIQENMIDFQLQNEIEKISPERKAEILHFFVDIKEIHVPEHSVVILTQHLANLRLVTFEEQALIYELFVDYFYSNQPLVIKPHPDDIMYYSRIFPEAMIIRERFPSEFFPVLLDNRPDCYATIYSTAIYNLRGNGSAVFELNQQFEKQYRKIHSYYFALQLVKDCDVPIGLLGGYSVLMDKLAERENITVRNISEEFDWEWAGITIVDDISDLGDDGRNRIQRIMATSDQIFVFLNSQKDFCWYDIEAQDLWEYMMPIVLKKKRTSDATEDIFFSDEEDEILYIYAKNSDVLERMRNMEIKKELPHVGIELQKETLSHDEEQIKVLEGILAATEQRLLYYINRVKELEKNKGDK